MPRPRTVVVSVVVALVLVVTGLLFGLPVLIRRVAVDRLTTMTGRTVALERVGLNPFTGRVALDRFRLAQRNSTDPALELEGLEVRVSMLSLLTQHIRVKSIALTAPRLHVARLTPTEFDFSDLLALIPPADPNAKPSTRTIAVDRITLTNGRIIARDDVARSTWTLDNLTVDGSGLSTRADPPGRLTLRATLNGTPLVMEASSIEAAKGAAAARVTLEGFDVALARPYVPSGIGLTPTAGHLTLALDLKAAKATEAGAPPRVTVSGDAKLERVAVLKASVPDPFVKVGSVTVKIKDAEPLAGLIALDTVTIDGVDLKMIRDKQGQIDLLALTQRPPPAAPPVAPAAAPAPAAPAPSARPLTVTLRELALRGTTVTMRDEAVDATLALKDVTATVRDVKWPSSDPLTFEVATGLPGAGRIEAKGSATLAPLGAEFVMSMRGAPIEPYQPYLPIPGRLVGRVNADSTSKFSMTDGKLVMAISQGKSWVEGFEIREPKGTAAPVKIARIAIDGVDFAHPGKAKAKTITVSKPQFRIERAENGDINLRRLFAAETPPITTTRTPAPVSTPAAPPADDSAGGFKAPMPLEIGSIVIEDGDARFIDRTTQPDFSETISRLAVRVDDLSSEPGRRAKLAVQAIVGSDSALDLKGELAPFGALYADISGEMRRFTLPTVNPYAESVIAWIIERGTLTARLHYTIEKNQITASNEIIVENLHVAKSRTDDEVQKRIGLPLGMIVALVTDSNNSIRVNLPITGTLQSWSADLSDAIWTVVKNAVVNIVSAPFKAIGRLFTGSGDKIASLAVDPARFAPGSATVAPEAESHLTKVADFLRKSPAVTLTLAPVTTSADGETLRAQELAARLQRVQREAKLKDLDAAVAAEFKRVFPGEPLPKTTDEQVARLRERAEVPPEALEQLARQRVDAVRETLAAKEGIQPSRLVAGAATNASSGDGRVEFKIGQ
jgi:uncharacterized protein involved in outer membrane biogenesis